MLAEILGVVGGRIPKGVKLVPPGTGKGDGKKLDADALVRRALDLRPDLARAFYAFQGSNASVDEARRLWDQRIAARQRFVDHLRAVDPPDSATELHAAGDDIMGRLVEAEAAMGMLAGEYETVASLGRIWNTPEGQAARAVDQEAVGICRAAQASFDETAGREVLADVPWVTSDMKEVIDVVFGCTAEERRATP